MRTRHVVVSLATLAAGVVSPTAWALSCDDVIQLVEHGVPETVIVEQVKSAGESYSADEVSCLEGRGAPKAVVGQAKRQMSAAAPAEIAAAVSAGNSAAADLTEEAVDDSLPKRAVGRTPEYRATKAAAAALCAAVLKAVDAYQCAKDAHSKDRESSERTAAS